MSFLRTIFTPPFFKQKIDFYSSSLKKYTFIEIEKIQLKSRTLVHSCDDLDFFIKVEYDDYKKINTICAAIQYNQIVFFKNILKIKQEETINKIISYIDYFEKILSIDKKQFSLVLNYFNDYMIHHHYQDYSEKAYVDLKLENEGIFIFTFLSSNGQGGSKVINKSFFTHENICWCHEELLSMENRVTLNNERIQKCDFEFIFLDSLNLMPNDIAFASIIASTYKNSTHYYHEISISNHVMVFRIIFLIDKSKNFSFKVYKSDSKIESNFNPFIHSPNEQDLYFQSIIDNKLNNKILSNYISFDKFEINDYIGDFVSDTLFTYFACPNLLKDLNFSSPLNDEQINLLKLYQY